MCLEDPFITMLGFKACMMGWRVVRLMILNTSKEMKTYGTSYHPTPTQDILSTIIDAINSPHGGSTDASVSLRDGTMRSSCEIQYLEWADRIFCTRNTWPVGGWMTAVLRESLDALLDNDDISL